MLKVRKKKVAKIQEEIIRAAGKETKGGKGNREKKSNKNNWSSCLVLFSAEIFNRLFNFNKKNFLYKTFLSLLLFAADSSFSVCECERGLEALVLDIFLWYRGAFSYRAQLNTSHNNQKKSYNQKQKKLQQNLLFLLKYCCKCTINSVYEAKKVIKLQKSRMKKLFYINFMEKKEFSAKRIFSRREFVVGAKKDTKKCIELNCLKLVNEFCASFRMNKFSRNTESHLLN